MKHFPRSCPLETQLESDWDQNTLVDDEAVGVLLSSDTNQNNRLIGLDVFRSEHEIVLQKTCPGVLRNHTLSRRKNV